MTDQQKINDTLLNVPVLFGLEAQGHIPVIEEMLDNDEPWERIAEKIGWSPRAACESYVRYLRFVISRKG